MSPHWPDQASSCAPAMSVLDMTAWDHAPPIMVAAHQGSQSQVHVHHATVRRVYLMLQVTKFIMTLPEGMARPRDPAAGRPNGARPTVSAETQGTVEERILVLQVLPHFCSLL